MMLAQSMWIETETCVMEMIAAGRSVGRETGCRFGETRILKVNWFLGIFGVLLHALSEEK